MSGTAQSAPKISVMLPFALPWFHGCFIAKIWFAQLQQQRPLPGDSSNWQSIISFQCLFQPDNRAINRTSRLFLRYAATGSFAAAL
jgi:hypothetical protein